ncbi:hypothetical protein [Streptomyces sp. NPDC060198]|uniref:hypothetical protein n=1 Tax=Streptomyces sp. NPDC060198 TaxID=3347070 RepID=UPI00365BC753
MTDLDFSPYDGYKNDFEIQIGPISEVDFSAKKFGDNLWMNILDILGASFGSGTTMPGRSGFSYSLQNDELSVSLYVGPIEEDGVLGHVPASLTAISRFEDVESSKLAEVLYAGLTASGGYLVVVFAHHGKPIAANFDVGDDW